MPAVYYRTFRTRGVYANYKTFRRVINNSFQNRIGPDLIRLHEMTTADWQNKPEFTASLDISQQGIEVSISARGDDKVSMIWNALNKGVPGRTIRPNPSRRRVRIAARKRRLGRKYRRETRKIGRLRRPMALKFTGLDGETVFRHSAEWRGIKARKYTEKIAKEYRPIFRKVMENTLRRAVRAAQREGS